MDPQLVKQVMSAFKSEPDIKNTQLSPITFNRDIGVDGDGRYYADGGPMFGVGVPFDNISNQGVDFSTVNLGIQMELGLISDYPQTIFLFVRNKNTLVFNANGLQVIA